MVTTLSMYADLEQPCRQAFHPNLPQIRGVLLSDWLKRTVFWGAKTACAQVSEAYGFLKKNSAVTAPDRPRDQTTDEISPPPTSLTALAPPALAQPCLSQKTGSNRIRQE